MLERLSAVLFTRRNAAWWLPAMRGSPFITKSRTSPSIGIGEHLLGDHVTVATDRLDHLVEVGRLVTGHEEHAGAARALQRLEHRLAPHGVDEAGDVADVARDERLRSHRLRELLEVGLVHRVGEAVRVVDDERAAGRPRAARRGSPDVTAQAAPPRRRRDRCASPARRGRRPTPARWSARRPARSRGRRRGPCACSPWRSIHAPRRSRRVDARSHRPRSARCRDRAARTPAPDAWWCTPGARKRPR